ncbi:hypothetical protein GO013_10180 [Pseudodesulfovibrio sp. JC047]|uniref:hypothetical protein n=1 Tax=Pseudodesulfovibrio sp. JC047 TaxID=2683199 RepID=UPI0013D749E8|nr:hypothetical protein [Pseudodesulfovibrio sp. JC047]NDV19787.1 hypothetical protein [Pseudodesulfovibrio sp. JC047]
MRNILRIGVVLTVVLFQSLALAGTVDVFRATEETVSPMKMRSEAMAEGFALAVVDEALLMLPDLDFLRAEALKMYFTGRAEPYVQGYKLLSSKEVDGGLSMRIDVRVNRRTLRDQMKRMGLFETVQTPLSASVVWPENISKDDMAVLQELVTLTGLELEETVFPAFSLEYTKENAYKGRLVLENREWLSINKDLAVVWVDVWSRYFGQSQSKATAPKMNLLTISGWFSPDGVLEFDRVLRGWESAVQEAKLVDMDMQPTGVGATWDVTILNRDRLDMLLQSFLPQRGLMFQMTQGD